MKTADMVKPQPSMPGPAIFHNALSTGRAGGRSR